LVGCEIAESCGTGSAIWAAWVFELLQGLPDDSEVTPMFWIMAKLTSGGLNRRAAVGRMSPEGVQEMGQTRKRRSKEFKAKLAMEAVKGMGTLGELASLHNQ